MTIRPYAVADLQAVLAVQAESPEAAQWRCDDYCAASGDPNFVFLVCQGGSSEDHAVVGFAVFHRAFDEAELQNLAVSREHRRHGIGRELLATGIEKLREASVVRVFCEVRPSNAAALQLYRANGFKHLSARRNYYAHPAEDALVLAFDLAPADPSEEPTGA